MLNENYTLVIENTDQQIKKQFSLINKNLNVISKNIKSLLPKIEDNDEKELFKYLNENMTTIKKETTDNIINLEFSNDYNIVLNKIDKYSYRYNTEKFNETLKLRNELIELINEDLSEINIENGINVKNNIFKEINNDIEYHKRDEKLIFSSDHGEIDEVILFN